jgi:hypothetical protein
MCALYESHLCSVFIGISRDLCTSLVIAHIVYVLLNASIDPFQKSVCFFSVITFFLSQVYPAILGFQTVFLGQ